MTDYESDSMDGEQPRMVSVPVEEWERVQAQLQQAREVIGAVEWLELDESGDHCVCPWCKSMGSPDSINNPVYHAHDCPRQAFLAALEVKE